MYNNLIEKKTGLNMIISELHNNISFRCAMTELARWVKKLSHCECVGIRLEDNGDYPYYVNDGFPETFIMRENSLCAKDEQGTIIKIKGSEEYLLECMCGNVIRGEYDAKQDFFTESGSFWSNNTTELFANTTKKERQSNSRNYCNSCGYESLALIPIKSKGNNIGLIQLNDKKQDMVTIDLINYLELIGRIIGIVISNRLTLSKLEVNEKITNEVKSNYQALIDSAPDAIIAVDKIGRILMWNKAAEEIFGYTENEVIDKDLGTLIFPDNKANVLQLESIYNLMDLSSDVRNMIPSIIQSEALTRDGKLFPIEISVTRRRRTSGSINTIFIKDITELKQTQAEMARLDRLNLVGQIAAGIGHEIRNPMTTVRGYLQLLGEKAANADQKPTFDLMISELDRANFIITEFLSFAKTSKAELRIKNLNNVIKGMYPMIEADAFTQNKQILFIPGQISNLLLDEKEIIQLVLNICRNGFDAIEERGCVTIKTYTEDNCVQLTVQDDGCGIPEKYLQKIGTPFFTTKENGTGLGLSICYRIAHNHNAIIDIQSSPTGTTFIIRFAIPNDDDI